MGVVLTIRSGRCIVLRAVPGSSAERAGLGPNTTVAAVDNVMTAGLALNEITKRIRGPAGSRVVLMLLLDDGGLKRVSLVRDHLLPPARGASPGVSDAGL